jgi:hypothetical protein
MPFGITDDFERNPHFLSGGVATALPAAHHWDARDCTGPKKPGTDIYLSHTGLYITATQLPVGKFHRFRVHTDPGGAAFNFTSERTSLIGCIHPPHYPERFFNQGDVSRIFVYAGSIHIPPNPPSKACFHPPIYRPIRGCPTAYGWLIEVDSGGTGAFDMTILFFQGP